MEVYSSETSTRAYIKGRKGFSRQYFESGFLFKSSYTKNTEFVVSLSKEYLKSDDKVLIIDDFLAVGQAALGLVDIVHQSGASLAGIGIVIEKGFQDGGKLLRQQGIRVESLTIIKSLQNNQVVFQD